MSWRPDYESLVDWIYNQVHGDRQLFLTSDLFQIDTISSTDFPLLSIPDKQKFQTEISWESDVDLPSCTYWKWNFNQVWK